MPLFSQGCVPRNGIARKSDASARKSWMDDRSEYSSRRVRGICRPFCLEITSAAERHDRRILAHRGRYNASEYLPRAIRAYEQVHRIFSARGNASLSLLLLPLPFSLSLSLSLSRVNESANTGRDKATTRLRSFHNSQRVGVMRTHRRTQKSSLKIHSGKHNRDTPWPSRKSPISFSLIRISRYETRRFARGAEIARSALARGCARSLLGNNRS